MATVFMVGKMSSPYLCPNTGMQGVSQQVWSEMCFYKGMQGIAQQVWSEICSHTGMQGFRQQV